jgi:hypothetical protein
MDALPQPAYIMYRLVTADDVDMHVVLLQGRSDVWFSFPKGAGTSDLRVFHRRSSAQSIIVGAAGKRYVTPRAFFDPSWPGAVNAMRDGMFFWGDAFQPGVTEVPTPSPSPSPPPGVRTIAVEEAATSTLYDVSDGGDATCENGDQGHALHLKARRDPERYQLTYAVVDIARNVFCTLRFSDQPSWKYLISDTEFYGEVGHYWVRMGGVFEIIQSEERMIPVVVADPYLGAITQYHEHFDNTDVKLPYSFVEMSFPSTEGDELFSPPPL